MLLSLIVPCYNEEAVLPLFLREIRKTSEEFWREFDCVTEVIFVDDGSRDRTLEILRAAAGERRENAVSGIAGISPAWGSSGIRGMFGADLRIRYLSFSRNFGKEAAMYAGLKHARGDYIAIMDADLQHPPSMLRDMFLYLKNGDYDCAAARRESRQGEPVLRSFFSRMFYKIINKISDTEIIDGATDFRMMKRRMVDAILSLGEVNRFSKGIFSWVGFRTKWLSYENIERAAGQTKWSFWGLLLYSVQGIVGFSTAPLVFSAVLGLILCAFAFLDIIYIIIKTLLFGDPVGGWPSMMCMIMFLGGVQLFSIGVLGEYMAKTYLEVKRRPIYILAEAGGDAGLKNQDTQNTRNAQNTQNTRNQAGQAPRNPGKNQAQNRNQAGQANNNQLPDAREIERIIREIDNQ